MNCIAPPELDDLDILAYLDGEAGPQVAEHLAACPYCRGRAERLYRAERRLTAGLYRTTCPSPFELGEYRLGALSRERARAVGRHLATCPHCTREVAELESFLDDLVPLEPVSALEEIKQRVKVLVATLAGELKGPDLWSSPSLAPAYAGVRGEEQAPVVYEADGMQIVIEAQPDAEQEDRLTVLGLVVGLNPEDVTARLAAGDQAIAAVSLDEAGNFVIPGVVPGHYRLVLAGPEVEVHIEDLQV